MGFPEHSRNNLKIHQLLRKIPKNLEIPTYYTFYNFYEREFLENNY